MITSKIKNIMAAATVAAGLLALPFTATAMPLDGAIGFGGFFVPTGGTGMADATGLNIGPSTVTAAIGDFSGAAGASATWTDFDFAPLNPAPVSPLWTVTVGPMTWSFDLEAVSVDFQSSTEINLSGSGTLMATGFDDTAGAWTFSGDQAGQVLFSFSTITSTVDVPEPATLALLGLGILGLAAARRRS